MSRILVIDDDRLVREAAQVLFRARGYDVAAAEDGKTGIAMVEKSHFDLAIVDLFMPDMDGLQVISAIHRAHPQIRLIAASGFMFSGGAAPPSMPNFSSMASEAGASLTLYKPFRPAALMQAVEELLSSAAA